MVRFSSYRPTYFSPHVNPMGELHVHVGGEPVNYISQNRYGPIDYMYGHIFWNFKQNRWSRFGWIQNLPIRRTFEKQAVVS